MSSFRKKYDAFHEEADANFIKYLTNELSKIGVEYYEYDKSDQVHCYKYRGIVFELIIESNENKSNLINFKSKIPDKYITPDDADIILHVSARGTTYGKSTEELSDIKSGLDKAIEDIKPYLKWDEIQLINDNPDLDKIGFFEIKKFNEYDF